YHWTHIELKRHFDIEELLDEASAARIWKRANEKLQSPELSVQGILKKFRVTHVCTTDDPTDDLKYHRALAGNGPTQMLPAFLPHRALSVYKPEVFNKWVTQLGEAANVDIANLSDFLDALRTRHQFFHDNGCRLSDHGMNTAFANFCSPKVAA